MSGLDLETIELAIVGRGFLIPGHRLVVPFACLLFTTLLVVDDGEEKPIEAIAVITAEFH